MISLSPTRPLLFFVAVLCLVGGAYLLIHSAAFSRSPALLSLAIVFDLTVVTSGLFAWLVPRSGGWSPIRAGLVALLMVRVSLFILPTNTMPPFLNGINLLVLVEGAALVMGLIRLKTIVGTYRSLRTQTDAENALHGAFEVVFGKLGARLLIGEWAIVRYVLLGWQRPTEVPTGASALTTYRHSGQIALLVALGIVGLIELIGVHLLVARWNADVALWVTILSAYGLLVLIAEIIATIKCPPYQTTEVLCLRLGVRWKATIPRNQISRVNAIYESPAKSNGLLNATLLTAPNVLLIFRQPITVQGLYGIQRDVTQLALWVDGGATAVSQPHNMPD